MKSFEAILALSEPKLQFFFFFLSLLHLNELFLLLMWLRVQSQNNRLFSSGQRLFELHFSQDEDFFIFLFLFFKYLIVIENLPTSIYLSADYHLNFLGFKTPKSGDLELFSLPA